MDGMGEGRRVVAQEVGDDPTRPDLSGPEQGVIPAAVLGHEEGDEAGLLPEEP